jgi:chromosome segregation ATPase
VNMQSNDIDWKAKLEEEMAKVQVLEGEKATLSKSIEGLKMEKAIAEELAETQMETVARMKKETQKMQSTESEQFEEIMKSQTKRNEELKEELEAAKEEMVEMQSNEIELKKKLERVFIRVNSLLDQIDEKDETIYILQETNQQLMSRRSIPRVASRGSMRDTSEIMGEVDVLQEKKRMSPPRNMLPRQNNRSSLSKPSATPSSKTRPRQEEIEFDEYEIEVDQENY